MAPRPEIRKKKESASLGWLSGGYLAVGVMMGFLLALALAFFFTLFDSFSNWAAANSIPPLVIASVSLLVAFFALREQTRMRQAGTDPVIIAHLDQNPDEPMILELNLSNVGAGAALNVLATVQKPLNAQDARLILRPFETDVLNGKVPIKVILQGRSVSYAIGTGHQLLGDDPLEKFKVELIYEDIEGSQYESIHEIDVAEYVSRSANSPPLTKIWRELERIQQKIPKS